MEAYGTLLIAINIYKYQARLEPCDIFLDIVSKDEYDLSYTFCFLFEKKK